MTMHRFIIIIGIEANELAAEALAQEAAGAAEDYLSALTDPDEPEDFDVAWGPMGGTAINIVDDHDRFNEQVILSPLAPIIGGAGALILEAHQP